MDFLTADAAVSIFDALKTELGHAVSPEWWREHSGKLLSVLAGSWQIAAKALLPLPNLYEGTELSDETRVRQRYLDLITDRVNADVAASVRAGDKTQQQADGVLAAWRDAVAQVRGSGTVPPKLPEGLSAIVNPDNVKAVAEADAVDPLKLAARIPAGTPVLLTCSDADAQAPCAGIDPLAGALSHTDLDLVRLTGVSHVLRDDPSDSIANYAKKDPLSPQLTAALAAFAVR